MTQHDSSLWKQGLDVLKEALATLSKEPGVYYMRGDQDKILYVGKAKNLKNRVTQYTRVQELPHRLQRMISRLRSFAFTTTHTEVEALLLEGYLIKKHQPEFNILLKDDKDFPWIDFSESPFPRPFMHRGRPTKVSSCYGPFASSQAVYTTFEVLYRTFQLRSCSDSIFAQRRRPCLQYHIKRCSAPCVGYISEEAYGQSVLQAQRLLQGRNDEVQKDLASHMAQASARMEYEKAAVLRDRIQALSTIQSSQKIHMPTLGDADVIGVARQGAQMCFSLFLYRQGVYGGYRSYPMRQDPDLSTEEILSAFLLKTYASCPVPASIFLSHAPQDLSWVAQALETYRHGPVFLKHVLSGSHKVIVDHAQKQAERDLFKGKGFDRISSETWAAFQKQWGLVHIPQRIEIYDNSHIQGTCAYGAMVVASPDGWVHASYRVFRIQDPKISQNDCAMMRDVLMRRLKTHAADETDMLPDMIILDGGEGQWRAVHSVLQAQGLNIPLIAMAKGPDRHAGREFFYTGSCAPFQLPHSDPVLSLMQILRDEAHRFVITRHRKQRQKRMTGSSLDDIEGVGPRKRQHLLHHFGSVKGIAQAGQEDLERVVGIHRALARRIYEAFHPSE